MRAQSCIATSTRRWRPRPSLRPHPPRRRSTARSRTRRRRSASAPSSSSARGMVSAHLVLKNWEIATRFSARRRSARPSSRSPLPRRRHTRRSQHLALRRCASLTSARSSATWSQLASQLSRVVGLLAKSLTTLGRSRSRVTSAQRRSARSPLTTSLASLARFSLVVTSVAGENIVPLLLLLLLLLMQLHTQLRPQRRRSRRSGNTPRPPKQPYADARRRR